MSALPWLAETPWPTKQLPRDELTERIEHFLATHWMGVLCTYGKNGPIGSPVEFHADGMVLYILAQPGSPKIKAMQTEPRICFATYGENSGWASVQGAQLFGTAAFVDPGTPEHDHTMPASGISSSLRRARACRGRQTRPCRRAVRPEHWPNHCSHRR